MGGDGTSVAAPSALRALQALQLPMEKAAAAVLAAELPARRCQKRAPCTYADATSQVNAREEAKKKTLASRKEIKKHSKLKPGVMPPHDAFRGAMEGCDTEPSAFWMVMEARSANARLYQLSAAITKRLS